MSGDPWQEWLPQPYLVKRTDGTVETRYRKPSQEQRASEAIAAFRALPWYRRWWHWLVSAW